MKKKQLQQADELDYIERETNVILKLQKGINELKFHMKLNILQEYHATCIGIGSHNRKETMESMP